MQVCRYAGMQVCKYASMLLCKDAIMQVCKYASTQILPYAHMQVCKYAIKSESLAVIFNGQKLVLETPDVKVKVKVKPPKSFGTVKQ